MTTALDRFVLAQDPVIETAMAELAAGRKTSHWMWFVFPQARSLGQSSTAAFYGMGSLAEAQAYLLHPVLGARLIRAAQSATTAPATSLHQLFGSRRSQIPIIDDAIRRRGGRSDRVRRGARTLGPFA